MGFNSKFRDKNYVSSMCMSEVRNVININDFSYPEIETEVETFITENQTPLLIQTGSSSHMIDKVENVVSLHNPNYEVLNDGIRIWKEVA